MAAFRKFRVIAMTLTAATGTAALAYSYKKRQLQILDETEENVLMHQAHKMHYRSIKKWNYNWDQRYDPNVTGGKIRHIVLIRHGQYIKTGTDEHKILTRKGEMQAAYTGERLVKLGLPYTDFFVSTLTRAKQTGNIILDTFKAAKLQVNVEDSFYLTEGCPLPGSPITTLKPKDEDRKRLDYAFSLYFHRADKNQTENTCTVLVCHANVIRYLVCRALQLPEEAWTRFMLHHSSITWLSIEPDGKVILRGFGESGHIPESLLTMHSVKLVHDA